MPLTAVRPVSCAPAQRLRSVDTYFEVAWKELCCPLLLLLFSVAHGALAEQYAAHALKWTNMTPAERL
jgi:hypothetical protein